MAEARRDITDPDREPPTEPVYVDTRIVFLASVGIGALLDLVLQMQPAYRQSEEYQALGDLLVLFNPAQTILNSWFYGLFVFPVFWLGSWWYFSGMPLPYQLTSRDYRQPIRLTALLIIPFPILSITATVGVLTNNLESALYYLFEDGSGIILLVLMQLITVLLIAQIALGGLIWLDYRNLQARNDFEIDLPTIEIIACLFSTQAFGIPALWAARRYLGTRHLVVIEEEGFDDDKGQYQ